MSYTALYRKFRPDSFDEVKGQDSIVTTLKNQIRAERIGHAYLFCGTRGTGKTTLAKILAKTVNCTQRTDENPCGECASCKAVAAGASMDVIEMDAASNNSVEDIRGIVEKVSYSPAGGKYKIYIIDEVHMLSPGAFNALLKTLEEPPSYVIFILATTEVHKIPVTILSRCQRYDFKRISIDTITDRLKELTAAEQMAAQDKALRYIAKTADGSMRDALSLLDQCIAFHFGKELTYDNVLDVLGAVDTSVFGSLFRFVQEKNILAAMELLEEVVMQGRELTQFVVDFTWYLRNLLLVGTAQHMEDIIDMSSENLQKLKEEAGMSDRNTIMRYIRIFSELSGQIKYAAQKRILIELAIIKLCQPGMETNIESLLERIRELEKKLETGMIPKTAGAGNAVPQAAKQASALKQVLAKAVLAKAVPEDIKKAVGKWQSVIAQTQGRMKAYLSKAKLSLGENGRLLIVFEESMAAEYFTKSPENKEQLEMLLSQAVGKQIETEIRELEPERNFEDTYPDLSKIEFPIETIEE